MEYRIILLEKDGVPIYRKPYIIEKLILTKIFGITIEKVFKIETKTDRIIVTSIDDVGVHIDEILENLHDIKSDGDIEIRITITMMESSEIDSLPDFDGF